MAIEDEKVATTDSPPSIEEEGEKRLGSIDDLDALNVLGYKPELTRNRSMLVSKSTAAYWTAV
jgi:hypothetical protein